MGDSRLHLSNVEQTYLLLWTKTEPHNEFHSYILGNTVKEQGLLCDKSTVNLTIVIKLFVSD